MNVTDLKIYSLNLTSLFISMTTVEPALKIILLVTSIGYTIHKWWNINNNKSTE